MTASPELIPSLRRATAGNISMLSEFRTDAETFAHIAEARPFDKSVFVVSYTYTNGDGAEVTEQYLGTLEELVSDLSWLEAADEIHVRRASARVARTYELMEGLAASIRDDGQKADAEGARDMLELCHDIEIQLARLDAMRRDFRERHGLNG